MGTQLHLGLSPEPAFKNEDERQLYQELQEMKDRRRRLENDWQKRIDDLKV